MAGRGGYQAPANPAPVSGPGALSRRTDGGPTQPIRNIQSNSYGEGVELRNLQAGAPMAATPAPAQGLTPADLAGLLDRPTERPDEPLTAGAPFGPGPGPEALPYPQPVTEVASGPEPVDVTAELLRRAYRMNPTPHLRLQIEQLNQEGR